MFVCVGLSGVLLHLSMLTVLYQWLQAPFMVSQAVATYIAMISNFCLNNRLTYHDLRLREGAFFIGLLTFCAICSVGVGINLSVAHALFSTDVPWALAGLLGAVVGAVWNYGVSSTFTWRRGAMPGKIGLRRT
jgi:dolichol-phosphate mannosyltransferase